MSPLLLSRQAPTCFSNPHSPHCGGDMQASESASKCATLNFNQASSVQIRPNAPAQRLRSQECRNATIQDAGMQPPTIQECKSENKITKGSQLRSPHPATLKAGIGDTQSNNRNHSPQTTHLSYLALQACSFNHYSARIPVPYLTPALDICTCVEDSLMQTLLHHSASHQPAHLSWRK